MECDKATVEQCLALARVYEGGSADDVIDELTNLRDRPEQYRDALHTHKDDCHVS